jgi:hypothetical protein
MGERGVGRDRHRLERSREKPILMTDALIGKGEALYPTRAKAYRPLRFNDAT